MGGQLGSHHLRYNWSVKNVQKIKYLGFSKLFHILNFYDFLIFFEFFENPDLDLAALFFKFKKKKLCGAPG